MRRPDAYRWFAHVLNPSLRELFDVPSHLTSREKLALHRLARRVARKRDCPACIVEIGAYLGASSAFLAAGLSGTPGRVASVDTWNNDAMSEGARDTMQAFLANTSRFRDAITPIRGWSTDPDVVRQVSALANEIDLLFIDGDHSHDAVLGDWTTYAPMLAADAVVVMHDIGWAHGVQRVVDECIAPRVRRSRRLPNLWWGELHP